MTKKIKLLAVDDEERFLKTLSDRLILRGFDVTAATSGDEALRVATAQDFDLALVDLRMPGMGGARLLELLKERHPFIEVVILTGHGSIDSAVECTRLGSYGYLQKPCETEELLEVLKEAYLRRVKRRLELDAQKIERMLARATGESPLGVLRRLQEIDEGHEGPERS
jgi:DNA-binding NtrC family response regulator